MAAVSLSEAWNDVTLPPDDPPPTPPPTPKVTAARRGVSTTLDDADSQSPDPPPPSPPMVEPAPPPPLHPSYDELLYQLESLRKEESRRCTVYLAIGGILFAILFVYVDRLNQQVRMLNTFLLHRHMPTLAAVSAPMPFHT